MKKLTQMIYESFVQTKAPESLKVKTQKLIDRDNEFKQTLSDKQMKIYQSLDNAKMECDDMEIKLAIQYTIDTLKEILNTAIQKWVAFLKEKTWKK